jgi:hypothetical protein
MAHLLIYALRVTGGPGSLSAETAVIFFQALDLEDKSPVRRHERLQK